MLIGINKKMKWVAVKLKNKQTKNFLQERIQQLKVLLTGKCEYL